ncbi:UDP-glycosyltransferase UGT5-like isoform X1 [Lycorma delicatula]|uniref:UDP-glycosyltransferase UGT5-like isoform X1 n=1 Tax=Lycorma delicatula TaxID=130591 RepID=UPI003F50FB4A
MEQNVVIKSVLFTFIMVLTCCNAANIFCVFPTASYSHQQPMLALSHALAAKGHNLTVITTNPNKVPMKNYREIDMNFLYHLFQEDLEKFEKEIGFTTQKRQGIFNLLNGLPTVFEYIAYHIFNSSQIQHLIREVNGTNYDLMIVEPFILTSLLGFSDMIGNPPIVGIITFPSSSTIDIEYGNPVIPSYIPETMGLYSDHMSLWERFMNLWISLYQNLYITNMYMRPSQEKIMRQYFGNVNRNLWDLESNKSLLIVSCDLSTSYPKPLHPNTVYVGPMHIKTPPPSLPKDLQELMDNAEDGIIYFSLGSNMKGKSVPEEKREAFIKAFKQFPKTTVLWKWEAETDLPGRPDNVITRKWLPQQSILAHPKMNVFISQVGLQSFQEAVYYGVPMLGIPMFGDQDFNAKTLLNAAAGLKVEFQDINYELVYENLKQLLTNTSYKKNMMRLSLITKDKPMSAVDTAVWWVEYVLRHKGAPHLKPAALDLTWYQYYMVDIFVILMFVILTTLLSVYYVAIIMIRKLFPTKINSKKIKRN